MKYSKMKTIEEKLFTYAEKTYGENAKYAGAYGTCFALLNDEQLEYLSKYIDGKMENN
jgi:hypothetical protein